MMDIRLEKIEVRIPEKKTSLFEIPELIIPSGERLLIRGPSGIGKTTLLHLIAGLMIPDRGFVQIADKNLKYLSEEERSLLRRKHFGIVFQQLNLLEQLTATENIRLILEAKDDSVALKALEKLGMASHATQLAASLSLGEQQRVAVARVLAHQPSIILADEPTSSLDEANARVVIENLLESPGNPTVIVVSHDERLAQYFKRHLDFKDWVKS